MKKEDLLALAANPELIPGIYNYCDRWCERCPFTSRCLTFLSIQEDDEGDPAANDIHNEAFWKKISDSFELTFSLLEDIARKNNMDISDSDAAAEAYQKDHEALLKATEKTAMSSLASQYIQEGKKWLDSSQAMLSRKEKELIKAVRVGLETDLIDQEAKSIVDAMEVVSFYLFQIYIKLMSAQQGQVEFDAYKMEDHEQRDFNGRAKVALIGIDRSIGAWGMLLRFFPEEEESVLGFLSLLERLRSMVEKDFPDARKFIRPGFDE